MIQIPFKTYISENDKTIHIVFRNGENVSGTFKKNLYEKYGSIFDDVEYKSQDVRNLLAYMLYFDITENKINDVNEIDYIDFAGKILNINTFKTNNTRHIGTEYLDRTIYHEVYTKKFGNIRKEVRVFTLASSYLSKEMFDEALRIEKKFQVLNNKLRLDMERQGLRWRIPKINQKALAIEGKQL